MRKVNKMLMATVSILLCLVLISTSVVSGIYAKFVITKSGDAIVSLKAFGITLTFEQGNNKPAGATVTATPVDDNTISLRVGNIKMISPQDVNANSYDDLIKFVLIGTPNVSKVKLKLTVDFDGVENFNIPDKTVIDANHTITTGGNYLPFAFRAKVVNLGDNVLEYWRSPASDDALEVAFVNALKKFDRIKNNLIDGDNLNDNSIEVLLWDSTSTSPKLSISSMGFGYRVHINSSTLRAEGAHPTSDLEADAMYTYLANKTPAPTFTATYTVSIEQVID